MTEMRGQNAVFHIWTPRKTSVAGDPLQRLAAVVDFEVFREDLETALVRSDRTKGGRPPYDVTRR